MIMSSLLTKALRDFWIEGCQSNDRIDKLYSKIITGMVLKKDEIEEVEKLINVSLHGYDATVKNRFIRYWNGLFFDKSLYELISNKDIHFKIIEWKNIVFNRSLRWSLYKRGKWWDERVDMAEFDKQDYAKWKEGIYQYFIKPFVSKTSTILEIAFWYGRWTRYLLKSYKRFIWVDICQACVDVCKKEFADEKHTEFRLWNGNDLHWISDNSIDFAFSFDSFVHMEQKVILEYIKEISRVLKIGWVCVIHHSWQLTDNQIQANWYRASFNKELMKKYILENWLFIIDQTSRRWTNQQFSVDKFNDVITIFSKK